MEFLYTKSKQSTYYFISATCSYILPFSSFFAISLSLFLNSEECIISDTFHSVEEEVEDVVSFTFSIKSNYKYNNNLKVAVTNL